MAEAVAGKARQDMQMNVKDFLPGGFAVRQKKIDTLRPQTGFADSGRETLCHREQRTPSLRVEICQVRRVTDRHD